MDTWPAYVCWFYQQPHSEQQRLWNELSSEQRALFHQARSGLATPPPPLPAPVPARVASAPSRAASVNQRTVLLVTFVAVLGVLAVITVSSRPPRSPPSQSPPVPATRPPPRTPAPRVMQPVIANESLADPEDIKTARLYFARIPPACERSSAAVEADGTVTIYVRCSNAVDAVDGYIKIKDGIVTDIK